ncbi:MAG TPA: tRNA 2-selenouridine(34) synthase MnmH [Casimicrobiaceae bacterium]|nr:tRNA 2-selenouridine(34) synthase MnmH [Casimicrobiaceae bacterium]
MRTTSVGVDAIARHADILDVRTPNEFDEDHVPGAINTPVLSNEERANVGTIHAQASDFDARKLGAALISRNIADIVTRMRDKPRDFAPLVYCWRGGQRSRSLTHVLNEIGWRAMQLGGGYRAYRRHVVERLDALPQRFDYRVVCGLTGSGKSRLLAALDQAGAQVLDLEALAKHRGSLLGELPQTSQPSQRAFESGLVAALERFDVGTPVFVESESRRIGRVQLPTTLVDAMRAAPCVRVDLAQSLRVELLKSEYAHFLADGAFLAERLQSLAPLHGNAAIERWNAMAARGEFDALVEALVREHYDPAYARAIERNFPRHVVAKVVAPDAIDALSWSRAARALIDTVQENGQ